MIHEQTRHHGIVKPLANYKPHYGALKLHSAWCQPPEECGLLESLSQVSPLNPIKSL